MATNGKNAGQGSSKETKKIPMTKEPKADIFSCSSNTRSDFEPTRGNSEENVGTLPAVSASCEGITSLDWAIVTKTIFSSPESLAWKQSGCIDKQFKIMYIMCSSTLRTNETRTDPRGRKIYSLLSGMQLVSQ